MDCIFIPTEADFRRWIREAVQECLAKEELQLVVAPVAGEERLLNRKEVAGLFQISLVTLHDWMNRGLPCLKQRGRVYFVRSEVMEYVKKKHRQRLPAIEQQ